MSGVYRCVLCDGVFPSGEEHVCQYDQRVAALRKFEYQQAQKDRRDRFAMAALTGLAAAPDPNGNPAHVYAKAAVALADALIAELDKEK